MCDWLFFIKYGPLVTLTIIKPARYHQAVYI